MLSLLFAKRDAAIEQTTPVNADPQNVVHVKSKEERAYMRKLDLCLMVFICIS